LRDLIRELGEFMDEQDYATVAEFRGCMNLHHCPNPEAFERANYVRALQHLKT
jgi:dihydroorotate dehydrogenase (fumarate)